MLKSHANWVSPIWASNTKTILVQYANVSNLLCLVVVWYPTIQPISFMIISLTLWWSYDCPSASEMTLEDMKMFLVKPTWIDYISLTKQTTTKPYILCNIVHWLVASVTIATTGSMALFLGVNHYLGYYSNQYPKCWGFLFIGVRSYWLPATRSETVFCRDMAVYFMHKCYCWTNGVFCLETKVGLCIQQSNKIYTTEVTQKVEKCCSLFYLYLLMEIWAHISNHIYS